MSFPIKTGPITGNERLRLYAEDGGNKYLSVQQIADYSSGSTGGVTGSTTGSTFNDYFVDQISGTSDTFGDLTGTIDGINTTFTVSENVYASGKLEVYLNGQFQTQGTNEDWIENDPASGTFDFNVAPPIGSDISVRYAKTNVTSSTILSKRLIVETDRANFTLSINDLGVDCDATSSDIVVNLPPLADAQGLPFYISKNDSSSNVINLNPNGSETINGAANNNVLLISQYNAVTIVATPSEWRIF